MHDLQHIMHNIEYTAAYCQSFKWTLMFGLMLAAGLLDLFVWSLIRFSCWTMSVQTSRSVMWWAIGSQLRWHPHGPSMAHSSHYLHPRMEIGSWLQNMDRMGVYVSKDLKKYHHTSRFLSKRKTQGQLGTGQRDSKTKQKSLDRRSPTGGIWILEQKLL